MSELAASSVSKTDASPRRPRVAILGEFSSGKSTLINLITGGKKLRTQVTATQMPAIWMSHGDEQAYLVGLDGKKTPVDLDNLPEVSTSEVAYIRAFMKTPVLNLCDLIDTPGNSDPNIAAIAWERIAEIADIAVWCSPATQAWRQSEKAAWSEVPQRVRDNSILMLTRSDKLLTKEDRGKVLRRVTHDAGDLFTKVHMASLLNFDDVHEPLRDLIDLCRGIEIADTASAADSATALNGMLCGHDTLPSAAKAEINDDTDDAAINAILESAAKAEMNDDTDDAAINAILEDVATITEVEPDMPQSAIGKNDANFATTLWYELTSGVAIDDPTALDRAFREFLTKLDAEVASLRAISNAKIAS